MLCDACALVNPLKILVYVGRGNVHTYIATMLDCRLDIASLASLQYIPAGATFLTEANEAVCSEYDRQHNHLLLRDKQALVVFTIVRLIVSLSILCLSAR
jgi:hypothetical protein